MEVEEIMAITYTQGPGWQMAKGKHNEGERS